MVTLENELTFINSYTYLLQIRFCENIVFNIDTDEASLKHFVPPLTLQILIENAIKHNEVSSALPLTIGIKKVQNMLEVNNNLQLRTQHEISSKTGLQNIKDRYSHLPKPHTQQERTEVFPPSPNA